MSKCKICNCDLGETSICFGGESPALLMVPQNEYDDRVEENADQCIIDGKYFFVRGHIEIPVDTGEIFIWSAWVSLSERSFEEMSEKWDYEGRENSEPYFGWLMTNIPCYPETLHLKTTVKTQAVGYVPLISLEQSEHPLSQEQQHGITMDRVHKIIHHVMKH